MPRGAGSGIVSRIHVDDLAAIVEAGLFADLQGAWPIADEVPCSTGEIARWCAQLLQLKAVEPSTETPGQPISGRKVDGGKILQMLDIELQYPSWQTGIPASLAEENNSKKRLGEPV
jgi:nucleoside-diphosphate-sugar epimerase